MISGLTVLCLRLMAPRPAVFVPCCGVQALEATIGAGTLIKGLDEGLAVALGCEGRQLVEFLLQRCARRASRH